MQTVSKMHHSFFLSIFFHCFLILVQCHFLSVPGSVTFQPDIEAKPSEHFAQLDTVTNLSNLILEMHLLSIMKGAFKVLTLH